ncbi:Anthranilate synthase component 1 [compost metagenome]
MFKNGKAYVQSGAGIVWDSVPESEYMETVNKAKASLKAIRAAEAIFGKRNNTAEQAVNTDYYVTSGEVL